jgi:shikimate dehydrogenase
VSPVGEVVRSAVESFESAEAEFLPPLASTNPSIAAIGSVAPKALASPLLRGQLAERGIEPRAYASYAGVDELFGRREWTLALVLSPFKRDVGEACEDLTAGARLSGVVDTVLQNGRGRRTGVNTNAAGAAWAVRYLMGGARPGRCLIAGTGASARSCLVGLRGSYGELEVGVVGRDPGRTTALAEAFSVPVVEDIEAYAPDLVINTTTVGETRDDELGFPLEKALVAGVRYFDLNNRTSVLQIQTLERGCVTLSGILMQTVVNALRVHLLARKGQDWLPNVP